MQFDWRIEPARLSICSRANGSAWLLGQGAYGMVRTWLTPEYLVRPCFAAGCAAVMRCTDHPWQQFRSDLVYRTWFELPCNYIIML